MKLRHSTPRISLVASFVLLTSLLCATALPAQTGFSHCDSSANELSLSGTARNWQFLDAVGRRAALLGKEDGSLEAWVYPLKLFRDFRLTFTSAGRVIPAESLPRTIITRPESTSIRYIYDTFTVCETWFAPVNEPGAVVTLEVNSSDPLQVSASFEPDVAWMWPAGMGAAYSTWDEKQTAFTFGEEEHQFYGIAGSSDATGVRLAYSTNDSSSQRNEFAFGAAAKGALEPVPDHPEVKGSSTYRFAMAASFNRQRSDAEKEAQELYHRLLEQAPQLEQQAREYYRHYLASTVSLKLPDAALQTAYDWSRISTIQGLVDDPFAGKGLIAGFNVSGYNHRPGFSWFFGRDSIWTDLALDSIGDYASVRTALEFLSKYQRADGRVPHEIPQSVGLVHDWFTGYPYGFASADATPLYVIGIADYVRSSGDIAFAREKWDSAWRAYQWLKSTYGPDGLPRNFGVGHGWIEGGLLLPVSTELYQAGVGAECLRALSDLARVAGKNDVAASLSQEFEAQRAKLDANFWSAQNNFYGYALDKNSRRIDTPSVLGTVPMWFGLLDPQHGQTFVNTLAEPDQQADWGMRIISERHPLYFPAGYHFGSIWPLFTGWASVGEYRYHRELPAYANLRANAQLVFDGTLGRATEVLSGRYYTQLVTSTPHQIWSSAMIISPILRGMMGLSVDALNSTVRFEPHVPADWNDFSIQNLPVGTSSLTLSYHRTADELTLQVERKGNQNIQLEFAPAFSRRTEITAAEVNGHATKAGPVLANTTDQHVRVNATLASEETTIRLRLRHDFGIVYPYTPPAAGAVSQGLRFVSEQWNTAHDRLELNLAGVNGYQYVVPLTGDVACLTVTGAELNRQPQQASFKLAFEPGPPDQYTTKTVVLQFGGN